MKESLTAVLAVAVLAAMVIIANPGMAAEFNPGKQLGPKGKVTGPPLSPALQSARDADKKKNLDAQLKANAERKKAEKDRAEALKKSKYVGKAQPAAPVKK